MPFLHRAPTLLAVFVLALVTACNPVFVSKANVEITGEFRADGTCDVKADGRPMIVPEDRAQTVYLPASGGNPAQPGGLTHHLFCMADARHAMLLLAFDSPYGKSAPIGSYAVKHGPLDPQSPMTISVGYIDPKHFGRWTRGAGLGGFGGLLELAAQSGTVRFTQLDSGRVVGTVHATSVREWGSAH
jgi:hypothetical protein